MDHTEVRIELEHKVPKRDSKMEEGLKLGGDKNK